jgi:hypothetical protein
MTHMTNCIFEYYFLFVLLLICKPTFVLKYVDFKFINVWLYLIYHCPCKRMLICLHNSLFTNIFICLYIFIYQYFCLPIFVFAWNLLTFSNITCIFADIIIISAPVYETDCIFYPYIFIFTYLFVSLLICVLLYLFTSLFLLI